MKEPIIEINDFKGGMTLSKDIGKEDQFFIGSKLDFESKRGRLTIGYSYRDLWNLYGPAATAPKFNYTLDTVASEAVYLGGNDTKIYKWDFGNTVSEEHTDTNAGGVIGMAEYEDYLYYASDTNIGRYDFSTTWTDDWQTGIQSADWHDMETLNGNLYIGNGKYVAEWDNSTFTAQALDLSTNWEIRCLSNFGKRYLAIGANYWGGNFASKCKVFLWDLTSATWNDEITVPENKINAMVFRSGYLWIWAGPNSNIYVVPLGSRKATNMWKFEKENPVISLDVKPGAVTARENKIYFGLSVAANSEANSLNNNPPGIYSFSNNPQQFKLNIPYRGSQDYKVEFPSLSVVSDDSNPGISQLLFSEYDYKNTTYKLYNEMKGGGLSWYADTADYESFVYSSPINKEIQTDTFGVEMESLTTDMSVSMYYKTESDSSWQSLFTNFSTSGATKKIEKKLLRANTLQIKLSISGSSTSNDMDRPFIKRIFVTGHLTDKVY